MTTDKSRGTAQIDQGTAETDQAPEVPQDAAGTERLTYEQAREELVQVVQKLESGAAPLEESLQLWERGEQLARICQARLDGAKEEIDAARSATQRGD
jgi:exodeoxyribonuclease VII small subunit